MAFLIEDGTGIAGANSYMTALEFKNYHNDRDNDLSDVGADNQIEKLLILGTDYIEQRWIFNGGKEFDLQSLSFPRVALHDRDGDLVTGVPNKLKWALAEYALLANIQTCS